jgi:hypothetical protein
MERGRGSQFLPILYSERLAEAGVEASVGALDGDDPRADCRHRRRAAWRPAAQVAVTRTIS